MVPYKSQEAFSQPDCPLCGPSQACRLQQMPPATQEERDQLQNTTQNEISLCWRALIWRPIEFLVGDEASVQPESRVDLERVRERERKTEGPGKQRGEASG